MDESLSDSLDSEKAARFVDQSDASKQCAENAFSQLPDLPYSIAPYYLVTSEFDSQQFPNNFLKSAKWSPDGLCLLVSSEDNHIRLYEVSFDGKEPCSSWSTCSNDNLLPAITVKEGETIYDMAWYPAMNSSDPSSCCFFSTSRDNPVHVWDAFTGASRGIYCAYTDAEELDAAYSLCFDNTGPRLYCGFNNCIRIYDIERPGREHTTLRTFKRAHGQSTGQRGIVSCAAFNPDRSGLLAAGSYSRNVGLYDARAGRLLYNLQVRPTRPPANPSRGPPRRCATATLSSADAPQPPSRPWHAQAEALWRGQGHRGGVTQVAWGPDGNTLYTGARMDDEVAPPARPGLRV